MIGRAASPHPADSALALAGGPDGLVWLAAAAANGAGRLTVAGAPTVSPRFAVAPQTRYLLRFRLQGEARGRWAAQFYDAAGELLPGDHYGELEPTAEWSEQEFSFATKHPGVSASVLFEADEPGELRLEAVRLQPATPAESAAWVDALATTMPSASPIPHTRAKLEAGEPVRIVLLGDSIANDVSNAPIDVLLARRWPGAQVELRFTGRGGTGYGVYQHEVPGLVTAHQPDLLLLLSICNKDAAVMESALRRIVAEAREALPDCDIVLLTPHLANSVNNPGPRQADIVRRVAGEAGLPVIDLWAGWRSYLRATGRPVAWLLRDDVHMNERGRLLSARVVAAELTRDAG